jgi:hypothetical protein
MHAMGDGGGCQDNDFIDETRIGLKISLKS